MITRIDMDTFATRATRTLDERREGLEKARDDYAAMTRVQAETLPDEQLVRELGDICRRDHTPNPLNGGETREQLVDAAVDVFTRHSEPTRTLERLTLAAQADRHMARRINTMIMHADQGRETLMPEPVKGRAATLGETAYTVRWNVDAFMVAAEAAKYAVQVVHAIAGGANIRDEAIAIVKQETLRRVLDLPAALLSDGLGGAGRSGALYEAAGAAKFMAEVATTYGALDDGDDLLIDVGLLNR